MLISGGLGFAGIFLVLSILGLVVHHKWRNGVATNEEIMRLVTMASEEAEMAEVEAAAEYCSIPVAKPYQCAVCFCPTTTRCSQCKAVRYCSGKCQIIHWRQGHKNECWSPIRTVHSSEGSDFFWGASSENQVEMSGNDFQIEGKFKFSSEAPSVMYVDDDVKPCADKEADVGSASFSTSSTCITSSTARGESSADASISELLELSTPNRSEGHRFDVIAPDILGTTNSNGAKLSTSSSSQSIVNSVHSLSCNSELNKVKSRCGIKKNHTRFKIPRNQNVIPDGVQITSLGSRRTTNGAALSEDSVMDASKQRSLQMSSYTRLYSTTDDREGDSQLFEGEEVRSVSFSGPGEHSLAITGHRPIASVKSAKAGSSHPLCSKTGSIPTLSLNAAKGLRTSVQKVVQQFNVKKQPKPDLPGVRMDTAGKHNCKTVFPYKLFMQLYSCDKAELSPFGLVNCGNSCYANAVLQFLAFTRPLTSYLLQGLHSKACQKEEEWCFICEFECLMLKGMEGQSPLSPIGILSHIQRIGSHLGPGREEDAHEFLRYAIDTMQSVCLKEVGLVGPLAEESTLVGLTFGGYLHSKIKCMKCLGKSERHERIMDLTVEIDGDIGTLEEALAQFTATEILDGENKYQCSRCRSYEKAKKKLMIMEAPNILTIVLKRFQSGNFGKLNKSIRFPEILKMGPYMSGTSDKCPTYSLYAVVVHLDVMNTAFSGHYVCYVKNFQGEWFRIDDSTVIPVELERVLLEGAYMLLYARHTPRVPSLLRSHGASPDGKIKMNLEAVPSSYSGRKASSKARTNCTLPSMNSSMQQYALGKDPYGISPGGSTGNRLLDPEDWRFHIMPRIPMADSLSDSSSIFSCSDGGSCSTESTKDSSGAEDISGYIFGEVTPSWYHH